MSRPRWTHWLAHLQLALLCLAHLGDLSPAAEHAAAAAQMAVTSGSAGLSDRALALKVAAEAHLLCGHYQTGLSRVEAALDVLGRQPEIFTIHPDRLLPFTVVPPVKSELAALGVYACSRLGLWDRAREYAPIAGQQSSAPADWPVSPYQPEFADLHEMFRDAMNLMSQ